MLHLILAVIIRCQGLTSAKISLALSKVPTTFMRHRGHSHVLTTASLKIPRTLQHSTAQSRSLLPPSNMESSRIYIRNLPPGVTNEEFRKHFSMGGFPLTDSKVIPQRRIGYIGFKSPQDAARAVKYFNKTFIRTSRIGVELARSVGKGRCCRKKPSEQGHTDIMSSG